MKLHEITVYNQKEPLFEVFDNPWPLTNKTSLASKIRASMLKHYGDKISGLNVYERTDEDSDNYRRDVFIVCRHQGLWEVHQSNYDNPRQPISGGVAIDSSGPNPRFISTVLRLYMTKLPRGIRIVAGPSMFATYYRVLKHYLDRNPNQYEVSEVNTKFIGIDGRQYSAVEVTPKNSDLFRPVDSSNGEV